MDSILFLILAGLYAVLTVWGIMLYERDSSRGLRYLLFLVTLGLVWDNGLIGAGKWIGEGTFLETLSLSRFWIHALFTPLLTLVSLDLIVKAGGDWAKKRAAVWGAWLFTIALVIYELVTETLPLTVKPEWEYGALRYVSADESSGPPLMVIAILIPLFAAGIELWRRKVTPVLFWGTLLMLIGSAVPIPIESSAATNIFELILITSLWYSIQKVLTVRSS
ncbi:hypothetical protein [Paenibacillus lemnae]|uniref:Phospholipid phosphatase n=1 Tax=Paenibacillus lemnae TaxID=1330551 RepID=A0A848MBA0_PAELE|nr:hypothetical protein [Paenibacillus lemnae]NMO97342.1 hypothetical protein [Paenibacillus lemnae]